MSHSLPNSILPTEVAKVTVTCHPVKLAIRGAEQELGGMRGEDQLKAGLLLEMLTRCCVCWSQQTAPHGSACL